MLNALSAITHARTTHSTSRARNCVSHQWRTIPPGSKLVNLQFIYNSSREFDGRQIFFSDKLYFIKYNTFPLAKYQSEKCMSEKCIDDLN